MNWKTVIFICLIIFNFIFFSIYETDVLNVTPLIQAPDFGGNADLVTSVNYRFDLNSIVKNISNFLPRNTAVISQFQIPPDFRAKIVSFSLGIILIIITIYYQMSRAIAGIEPSHLGLDPI